MTDQVEWYPASAFRFGRLNPFFWDECAGRNLLLRRSTIATAITEFISSKFHAHNTPCLIFPSVYDFTLAASPEIEEVDESDLFVLLYAGNCKIGDGFDLLIEALRSSLNAGLNVQLKVLGTAGRTGHAKVLRDSIEADRILCGAVEYLGRVSDDEYPKVLASVDCLVLPRPDCQTVLAAFPTRLPEFLGSGVVVLTTSVPDVPLYLEAGVHAEIVEPSAKGLASGISILYQDPERAKKIGLNGSFHAREVFDYKMHTRKLVEFVGEQLDK